MNRCHMCGELIRRGYLMITKTDEDKEVIICERCKRLWKKLKAEEETLEGVDDETANN